MAGGTPFDRIRIKRLLQLERESAQRIARENSAAGLARAVEVLRTQFPSDPSKGGSTGYPPWFRKIVLEFAEVYTPTQASFLFNVSLASLYRWAQRVDPLLQRGNREREVLTNADQLLLTIAIHINPTSNADQIAAFIVRNGGNVYTRNQIYRRLKELGVVRKVASIESYRAFTPMNLMRARTFWTERAPVGVVGVQRRKFIDIDESKFALHQRKKCVKGYGVKAVRVRDRGMFKKGMQSVNLFIAIEPGNPLIPSDQMGSIKHPRCWFRITQENCNQYVFADYIDDICRDIEENPCDGDDERVFLWDNLSAHLTPYVTATYAHRATHDQHRFLAIPRPPYQPKFGPIEYIIGIIDQKLQAMEEIEWTIDTLRDALHNICMTVGNNGVANKTFLHVGYV